MPENPILTPEVIDQIARQAAQRVSGSRVSGPEAAGASSGLPQISRVEAPAGLPVQVSVPAAGAMRAVPDAEPAPAAEPALPEEPMPAAAQPAERPAPAERPVPLVPPERRSSAPYSPQDNKEDALWFVGAYGREITALQARLAELRADLRPYLKFSAKKRQKPEIYAQYEQLVGELGAIDAQAALGLPDVSDSLRADLERLRSEGLDELTRARQNLEAARSDAAQLGASAEEIEAAAPAVPEARPGLLEQPPTREPGETAEEYLEKLELWKDALKSGAFAVPKIAWGVASTLLGVRLAQTGVQFGLERWRRRKEKKAFAEMADGLEDALWRGARAPEAEHETAFVELIQNMQTMERRLDGLVREGKLKPEDRGAILSKIREVINRAQQQEQSAAGTLNQEIERILHDYFQTKVSKIELGKQTLNTGFLLAEVQAARALGYGAFVALARAVRARKEYEERLRIEERPADFWERERAVWQSLVPQAAAEYARGISGIWGDLFTGRRVGRAEWARKKMEFGKALSTTLIAAGMAKVVHAEMGETDFSALEQIDRVLDSIEKRGLGTTLGNNFLHNIEQLSFGLVRFDKGGDLVVADNPEEGVVKPVPAAPEAPGAPEAPEVTKTPEQIMYENALERLEKVSNGKVDFDPETGRLEIKLGEGGYAHIQQALRDIAVLEKMVAGKEFTTVDAAQVENTVANLKYLLEGKDLRFMEAERLDGIAHLGAGKLIIHDVSKFHEVMQEGLLTHAAGKITGATLERYDEAVATVNNTSDANWQRDVDVGTGVEDAGSAGYVKAEIDHGVVHKAEIQVAQHTAAELGISGAAVVPDSVVDEDNFVIGIGEARAVVQDGMLKDVVFPIPGDPAHVHRFHDVAIDHPTAADRIQAALQSHASAAAEAPEAAPEAPRAPVATEASRTPTAPADLIRPVSEGGLVGSDGRLHFGVLEIKVGWYEKWDDQTVERFVKDAPGKYSAARWFSDEANAHFKLARVMAEHDAPERIEVGKWILENYKKIGEWVK